MAFNQAKDWDKSDQVLDMNSIEEQKNEIDFQTHIDYCASVQSKVWMKNFENV